MAAMKSEQDDQRELLLALAAAVRALLWRSEHAEHVKAIDGAMARVEHPAAKVK